MRCKKTSSACMCQLRDSASRGRLMHLGFQCCVCGLMSPAAGVWLQDATYLAACMALLDGCGGYIDFDIIQNDISSLAFSI